MPSRYQQFKYTVQVGGAATTPEAAFDEFSGDHHITKITGMNKSGDVTLKRGVIDTPSLNSWLSDIRAGNQRAARDVIVAVSSADRSTPARRWRLRRARIVKHTPGPLNAKGTDIAMEEMVLSCERLEMF